VSTPSSAVPRARRWRLTLPTGPGQTLADALPGGRVRDIVLTVLFAGFVGLFAQLAMPLPFTPVPLSGQTFAVLAGGAALGWRRGLNGMLLYVAVGLAGVPWFADGTGGVHMLAKASFGYIVGFVVAAMVVGGMAGRGWDRKVQRAIVMFVAGSLIVYGFGLPWLMATAGLGLVDGVMQGIVPFLLGDAVKILVAAGLLPAAWWALRRRHG
jgi:biotin transport system substrate-specific component